MRPDTHVPLKQVPQVLLRDIRAMIESARAQVARAANTGLTLLYWSIGKRLREDILLGKRATYREQIVQTLSAQLAVEYGLGFGRRNLFNMIRFAETFPDRTIVSTLSTQMGWSHFVEIIAMKDSLERDFYAEMCRIEKWNVRTLRAKINSILYERTALSRRPAQLARMEIRKLRQTNLMTPDLVFRDPYFLDFLGLKGAFQEKDVESAILREMEAFILELGVGFTFVARQKRITVGGEDFYLDLLFYHRRLKRLVAVELKLGKFQPAYKGQMELYLRWLDKYERQPGERVPVGLILCADKSDEQVELLQLDKSGIRVSQYLLDLPPRRWLEKKLHQAIRIARERLAAARP